MKLNIAFFCVCLIILSCSNHDFKVFEGYGNCPVMLEVRKLSGFDLKFYNLGKNDVGDLTVTFDGKYKHNLSGLYSVQKGLLKDSVFKAGDTLTLQFNDDISNLLYFNVEERGYVPEEIILSNNECKTTWVIK